MCRNKLFFLFVVNLLFLLLPAIGQTGLTLLYKPATSVNSTIQLHPQLKIVNLGSTDILLEDIKIRYYYTKDSDVEETFTGEYTEDENVIITNQFGDGYVEIGFSSGTIFLSPAQVSGVIGIYIMKTDHSAYDQLNDYSYDGTMIDYLQHDKITAYRNGTLVWGTPPTPETLPTPDPSKRKLTINEVGRQGLYCTQAVELNPPGVWISGSKIYWYDYGTTVSIKLIAGTPRPTAAGGEDYQTITINGSTNPLNLVMDEDRTVTIEYTTHIVTTPSPEPTPTASPEPPLTPSPTPMFLLHLNVVDGEASEPGSDTAQFTIKEEFTGVAADGWMELGYTISGSAANGVDYEELSGTVWVLIGTDLGGQTPAPGAERDTITIIPIDDLEAEGSENVTITLTGYGDESATIVIEDNDETGFTRGDVNIDGSIDIIDALLIAQVYVSLDPENFIAPLDAGDVNCDSDVDIIDALMVAQFSVGLIDTLCE